MGKRLVNGIFVGGILLVLVLGLGKTLFFPKDINFYENRYAEKVAPFSLSGWLDGSFQTQMDAALSDQVNLAQTYKKIYNRLSFRALWSALKPLADSMGRRYVHFQGHMLYGTDTLVYGTSHLPWIQGALDARIEHYNKVFTAYPDTEFYVYYIEKDTDINFETGEKAGVYEYLRDGLELPQDRMARFRTDSFADFSKYFYATDHHWNLDGSYKAYGELLELLGVDEPALEPLEQIEVGTFSGSKGKGAGLEDFTEPFRAYRFAYPPMKISVLGESVNDYGNQEAFFNGTAWGINLDYGNFYGGDAPELCFSTDREERDNLLVIGESFDNAVLKLLASHFNNTYSIDLRYYEHFAGKPFAFSAYLAEHGISKVLLIGNVDYFRLPEFELEG